ncbi:hypothetical protein ABZS44_02715 [Micromonospora sediminicola]|uniref:hypothetical protein n=1 Tax=Micromonospora sediminicola TaxID=946078 RepID=UPI0033B86244
MIREMRFVVSVPDQVSAYAVAEKLAERGHLLVAVREVPIDPLESRFAGWWRAHSLAVDPPYEGPLEVSPAEKKAVAAIAQKYGGQVNSACGQFPDKAIERFSRKGLAHKLDRTEADRIRAEVVGGQTAAVPSLPAPPGLKCGGFRRPAADLRAAAEVVPFEGRTFDGVGDLIAAIANDAFPQGSVVPAAPGAVPRLAALAGNDGVSDFHRAMTLMVLFQMSTAGRRRLAYQADAPEDGGAETPAETATRAAVAAVLPGLAVGRSELAEFLLAGLSAAMREAGAGMPAGLERIAGRYAGTARITVVNLIRAVADGAEEPLRTATAAVVAALPEVIDGLQSTKATVEGRALDTLDTVLQWELDNARLSKLGTVFGPR